MIEKKKKAKPLKPEKKTLGLLKTLKTNRDRIAFLNEYYKQGKKKNPLG